MRTTLKKTKRAAIRVAGPAKTAPSLSRRVARPKLKLACGKSLEQIHLEALRKLRELGIFI